MAGRHARVRRCVLDEPSGEAIAAWPARLDYESHATALGRNELGAMLVAVGLGTAAEHALISLLAPGGPRVSEATGASAGTASTGARHYV